MSAKNTKESVITLPESEGVLRDLLQRLTGKRARSWFNALKRFLQKENPWIPMEKITWVPKDYGNIATAHMSFSHLKNRLGMNLDSSWDEVFACDSKVKFEEYPEEFVLVPPHDIVSVRIGDLLTPEEAMSFGYNDILRKAREEHGLATCDLRSGLYAICKLVKNAMSDDFNMGATRYTLCIKPIASHRPQTVPLFSIYCGKCEQQGTVLLRDVYLQEKLEAKIEHGDRRPSYMSNDDRLIFRLYADEC